VISSVRVVHANDPWAFVAVRATDTATPRWAFVPAPGATPVTGLEEIALELRARLGPHTDDLPLDERAAEMLSEFLYQRG